MKKLIACALACLIFLSLAACGTSPSPSASPSSSTPTGVSPKAEDSPSPEDSKWPSYLNLDSTYPVIKEGEGSDITLRAMSCDLDTGYDWENYWLAKYIDKYMNINMEMERVMLSALAERKTLLFASDDLPDMMLCLYLNTSEIVKYGQIEGQLMQLEDYIDEKLTPDIKYWFDEIENAKPMSTTPDGHIYTIPQLSPEPDEGSLPRVFLRMTDLEAVGKGLPETLDQFVETARALKAARPEKGYYPISASIATSRPIGWYFLNALGYVDQSKNNLGILPAVRNGVLEFPVDNVQAYTEYLRVARLLFEEELVPPEFLDMDEATANAYVLNEQCSISPEVVYISETWPEWQATYPLTSSFNSTRVWPDVNYGTPGGFAISAKSKYPEICMRFLNAYYSTDAVKLWLCPPEGSEEAMGYIGPHWDDEKKAQVYDESKFPSDAPDVWSYLTRYVSYFPAFGCFGQRANNYFQVDLLGGDPIPAVKTFDLTSPEGFYRESVTRNLMPYCSEVFPRVVYMSEEDNLRLLDLYAVIEPYVKEQLARFVNGDRPVNESEVEKFLGELQASGWTEYRAFYQKVWDSYVASK